MADLSNTSPWIGVGQGLSAGIRDAGVIQGLMQNKQLYEQQVAEAPMRRGLLVNQLASSGLALTEAQKEAEFNNRPWEPEKSEILSLLPPEQGTQYIAKAKSINPGKPLTMLDKKRFESTIGQDLQTTKWAVEGAKAKSDMILMNAYKNAQANPGDQVAKQNFEKAYTDRAVTHGELEKLQTRTAVANIANDPNMKPMFVKYPALLAEINLAHQTGDPKAFQALIQKVTELQTAETYKTADRDQRAKLTQDAIDARAKEGRLNRTSRESVAAAKDNAPAKGVILSQVRKQLVSQYLPLAKDNMGDKDFQTMSQGLFTTDQFGGSVNDARLRTSLNPEQRTAYDWIGIEAEKNAAKMPPAQAVNEAIKSYWAKFPRKGATGTGSKQGTPMKPLSSY